jgi:UDP-N-acetylmuramate: L-alanyl-gamma-D-glutamyl-meso-diaminopimelate ligase
MPIGAFELNLNNLAGANGFVKTCGVDEADFTRPLLVLKELSKRLEKIAESKTTVAFIKILLIHQVRW